MIRFTRSVQLYQDAEGKNPDEAAPVRVLIFGTATEATIFSDDAGTIPLAQPFLTNLLSQENPGQFTFVVSDGTYDIEVNGVIALANQTIKDKDAYNLTKAEMISANYLRVGDVVIVTDRADGRFDIVTGETGDTWRIIQLTGTVFQAKLRNANDVLFVEQFGAKSDANSPGFDSSDAIISAISFSMASDRPMTIQFGIGKYNITKKISTNQELLAGDINGVGSMIVWKGTHDGGIAFEFLSGSFGGMKDIEIRGDQTQLPTNWIVIRTTVDKTHIMKNVHFNRCFGDCIVLDQAFINLHWEDMRWDNLGGYAINCHIPDSISNSSFVIDKFTYDHSVPSSTCQGVILMESDLVVNPGIVELRCGRIEINESWTGNNSIFTYQHNMGSRGLLFLLSEVTFSGTGTESALFRDTVDTSARDSLAIVNCRLGVSSYLAGTWPSNQNFPVVDLASSMYINCGDISVIGAGIKVNGILEGSSVFEVTRKENAIPAFSIEASGNIKWGTGGASLDTELKRNGSGNLRLVSGTISADGGFGTGNSASASSLGSVTKKMEVFDLNGSSIGFIPIYDSIT